MEPLKKLLSNSLKIGLSVGIIGWLIYDARRDPEMANFELPTELGAWGLLLLAFVAMLLGVTITIVRWYILVRALELPFSLKDAFRLGYLCYLLNFVSLGSVGGDLFKAVFIAREQPGRRPEAVATVVIDRVIGLYGLFILASISILATGLLSVPVAETRYISRLTLASTVVGFAAIAMLIIPGFTTGALSEFLSNLPKVGPTVGKLILAVRMYRRKMGVLFLTIGMSVCVHGLAAIGIYCIAQGLFQAAPSLGTHLVVVPLSMLSGVLPLPFMGLGAFEAALVFLFDNVAASVVLTKSQCLLVAFGYRVVTILIAIVGAGIYISSRHEVDQLMQSASDEGAESIVDVLDAPSAAPDASAEVSKATPASSSR